MKNSLNKSYGKSLAAVIFCGALCMSACTEQTADLSETSAVSSEETAPETTASETSAAATTITTVTTTSAAQTTEETTAQTEPEITFESEEAENLYNIIMKDQSWRREEIAGATILDVHGDGVPEFLAVYADEENNRDMVDCYSLGEENLEFMYSFEALHGDTMVRYADNGVTKWWGIKTEYEEEEHSDKQIRYSYRSENTYGFFEFTENGPVMTEEMFRNITEYDRETDIYKGEMYTNGELYGTDCIEKYSNLEDAPALTYYGWYTDKAEWEGERFTNDDNYLIAPNRSLYNQPNDIHDDALIAKLVNAYCTNDKEYLTRDGYFGEVNAFKPVIYLYPTEISDISVNLRLDGALACSYPDYGSGWHVTAKPDGTLYDKGDGSEYSYLYWEAALNARWDMTKGFSVKGSDTAEFLREKLSFMGLTPREYNEFIVYWLPLMQGNEYNFITFQTEAYTNAAQLEISPKPDSMLRVFMVYKPLEEPVKAEEPELPTFDRSGFTVVEWGGTKY